MKLRLLLLLIAVTMAAKASGQVQDMRFKHLNASHGLSSDKVLSVFRDHHGFMWFGTEVGLNKYDGVNFTIYRNDVTDSLSLEHNQITDIIEDKDQNLWIATFGGGLNLYNRSKDTFTSFKNKIEDPKSLSSDFINEIFEDSNNDIWIGSINGLSKFNKKTGEFSSYYHDPANLASIAGNSVAAIFEDSRGNFWIGTSEGLNLMDRKTGTFKRYTSKPDNSKTISHKHITSITEDKAGNLWVGTRWDGLNRFNYDDQTFTRFRNDGSNSGSIGDDGVLHLYPGRKGNLWVGTANGGLNFYHTETGTFFRYVADYSDKNSLSNGAVNSVYEDNSGTLWVATGEGISYFNPSQQKFQLFRNKYNKNSLSGNKVKSFAEDKEGNLWIAVDGGGLNHYNRKTNTFSEYNSSHGNNTDGISNQNVHAVLHDSKGYIWTGTYNGGLDRLDRKTSAITHFRNDPEDSASLANNSVKAIIEDRQGNIWVGTNGGGLNRFHRETNSFTRYPCGHGGLNCWVNSLFEDRKGNIWVSTMWGLSRFDPAAETFTHFHNEAHLPESLSSNEVNAAYEDGKGNLWVATKNGLNLYLPESGTFKVFTKADGLPDNSVMSIEEDGQGNLWLGTLKGLSQFNPEQKTFRNYSQGVGVQGDEFLAAASFKTRKGELLFGGSAGFNLFHPDSIKDNSQIPPVFLTSFAIFNKPVQAGDSSFLKSHINEAKEITLSYLESVFSFEYAALNFIDGGHNKYAYMMEGFDKEWHYVGTEKKATYTNLDPGAYTFRVKASNNDGVWNEEGTALSLIITPPFWKTWWFRAMVLLTIIGGAVGFYRARMNAVKAQKAELERLVKEKTASLQEANGELTERQEEILQQQEELEQQRDHLRIVNEQVMSSIQYAQSIQKAILPARQKIKEVFPEHFIIYRPKDVVSGDFYWFSHLTKEETGLPADLSFMAAVDCTGHGVPGAFMSIIGSTVLNEIVNQKHISDPAQILELLDMGVKHAVEKAEGINTAGMDVCLCVFEKGEGNSVKVLFSGAKRDLIFVRAGATAVEKLPADRRSIGSKSSTAFTTQELVLDAGSLIYFTTDGYADQNNMAREKMGAKTLNRLISRYCGLTTAEQQQMLEKALDEHQQGSEQRDDITLVGVKI